MRKLKLTSLFVIICLVFTACSSTPSRADVWENALYTEDTSLGEGSKTFYAEVTAGDKSVTFTISTDKATVGEALIENEIVSGEQGPYGLYVKLVNGIEADYDKDKSFWSFTKEGEQLLTGVDGEKISDGAHYELVYTTN